MNSGVQNGVHHPRDGPRGSSGLLDLGSTIPCSSCFTLLACLDDPFHMTISFLPPVVFPLLSLDTGCLFMVIKISSDCFWPTKEHVSPILYYKRLTYKGEGVLQTCIIPLAPRTSSNHQDRNNLALGSSYLLRTKCL